LPAGALLAKHTPGRVVRGKFVAGLDVAFRRGRLVFSRELRPLANDHAFRAFLRPLFRQDWVVYAKSPFGGSEHVLHYLAFGEASFLMFAGHLFLDGSVVFA
jgi:putative transposase